MHFLLQLQVAWEETAKRSEAACERMGGKVANLTEVMLKLTERYGLQPIFYHRVRKTIAASAKRSYCSLSHMIGCEDSIPQGKKVPLPPSG